MVSPESIIVFELILAPVRALYVSTDFRVVEARSHAVRDRLGSCVAWGRGMFGTHMGNNRSTTRARPSDGSTLKLLRYSPLLQFIDEFLSFDGYFFIAVILYPQNLRITGLERFCPTPFEKSRVYP